MAAGGFIIIAGERLPIEGPVRTFEDPEGFDARFRGCTRHWTKACGPGGAPAQPAKGIPASGPFQRFRERRGLPRTLAAAQGAIRQLVVHLDGCADAVSCFNVLHNERGLSCHFILDNDGVLYQTLDLIDCAFHAAGLNETSIGIEICNRGDARPDRDYYARRPHLPPRDIVECTINGGHYTAFDFTEAQKETMVALGRALARHLPAIKLDYPQASPGVPSWDTLEAADASGARLGDRYSGWLGHYHITRAKWDPGPFDFKRCLGLVAGRRSFPVGLHGAAREVPEAPVHGQPAPPAYAAAFEAYHDNHELVGGGGFFPVGPLDAAQLYHGGAHLHVARGTDVVAPFGGRVVLARNRPIADAEVGSTSFVLLRHDLRVGAESLTFFTLLYHLAEEAAAARPAWMAGPGWAASDGGRLTVLGPPAPVEAGEVVGHVGVAGPDAEAQLHWEIFTLDLTAVTRLDAETGFWQLYSRAGDRRVCTDPRILAHLERKRDGVLTQEELLDAFRGDPADREWARHAVTFHYSEWSARPDWIQSLRDAPGARPSRRRAREIEAMVEQQIVPGLWWTDEVAQALGLPADARVYTFHPVSFVRWLNDLTADRPPAPMATVAGTAKLDIDDHAGESMLAANELEEARRPSGLDLPDILDGYGD